MKRTLLTSVALGAMVVGASISSPALDFGFVTPAAAQDANQTEELPVEEDATTDDSTTDSGATDSGTTDGGTTDSGATDDSGTGGTTDSGTTDGGTTDDGGTGGATDGGTTDSGTTDDSGTGGTTDGGTTDSGTTDDGGTGGTTDDGDVPADDAAQDAEDMQTDTAPGDAATDDAATDDAATGDDMATEGEASGQMFINEQGEEEVSANTYIGQSLYNMQDESIGNISDLIFGTDGGVKTAVVGVGGFLGIGQKDVGVNFDMIEIEQQPDSADVRLVIEASREELENAAEFVTLDDKMAERQAQQPPAGGAGTGTGMGTGGGMGTAPAPAQ